MPQQFASYTCVTRPYASGVRYVRYDSEMGINEHLGQWTICTICRHKTRKADLSNRRSLICFRGTTGHRLPIEFFKASSRGTSAASAAACQQLLLSLRRRLPWGPCLHSGLW